MKYVQLGNTSLKVSEIGIGTEHLGRCSQKVIDSVFKHSVESGFNYFDILTGSEIQRDKFGEAIKGIRDKIIIAVHFNSKTRVPTESKNFSRIF